MPPQDCLYCLYYFVPKMPYVTIINHVLCRRTWAYYVVTGVDGFIVRHKISSFCTVSRNWSMYTKLSIAHRSFLFCRQPRICVKLHLVVAIPKLQLLATLLLCYTRFLLSCFPLAYFWCFHLLQLLFIHCGESVLHFLAFPKSANSRNIWFLTWLGQEIWYVASHIEHSFQSKSIWDSIPSKQAYTYTISKHLSHQVDPVHYKDLFRGALQSKFSGHSSYCCVQNLTANLWHKLLKSKHSEAGVQNTFS